MNQSKQKAVVLTNAFSSGLSFRDEGKKRGYKIVGLLTQPLDFFETLGIVFKPPYVDNPTYFDEMVIESDLDLAYEKLKGLDLDLRGFVPGSELGVFPSDTLADRFGLNCNKPELIHARRDKALMKEAVAQAGLRTVKHSACYSVAELITFANKIGFPIVLKPPYTCGGLYKVFFCHTEDDLKNGFNEIYKKDNFVGGISDSVLAEECIDGTEYVVNIFGDGKDLFVTDIWRYVRTSFYTTKILYLDTIMERVDNPKLKELKKYALKMAKALGAKFGPIHSEIMVDDKGPVMMEINARLGGGRMPHFCKELSGFDTIGSTIDILCDNKIDLKHEIKQDKFAWIVHCPMNLRGKVVGIHGLDEIEKLKSYHSHIANVKVGDKIETTANLGTNPLFVWLVHEDKELMEKEANAVRAIFNVEVE